MWQGLALKRQNLCWIKWWVTLHNGYRWTNDIIFKWKFLAKFLTHGSFIRTKFQNCELIALNWWKLCRWIRITFWSERYNERKPRPFITHERANQDLCVITTCMNIELTQVMADQTLEAEILSWNCLFVIDLGFSSLWSFKQAPTSFDKKINQF